MTSQTSPRISVKDRAREIEARSSEASHKTSSEANAGADAPTRGDIVLLPRGGGGTLVLQKNPIDSPKVRSSKLSSPAVTSVTTKSRSQIPEFGALLGVDHQNRKQQNEGGNFLKVDPNIEQQHRRCSEGDLISASVTTAGCIEKASPPPVPPRVRRSSCESGTATHSSSSTTTAGTKVEPFLLNRAEEKRKGSCSGNNNNNNNDNTKGSARGPTAAVKSGGPSPILGSFKSSGSVSGPPLRKCEETGGVATLTSSSSTSTSSATSGDDVGISIFSKRCRNPILCSSPLSSCSAASSAAKQNNSTNNSPLEDIIASLERICDEFDSTGEKIVSPRVKTKNSRNGIFRNSSRLNAPENNVIRESSQEVEEDDDNVSTRYDGGVYSGADDDRLAIGCVSEIGQEVNSKCAVEFSADGVSSVKTCPQTEEKLYVSCARLYLSDATVGQEVTSPSKDSSRSSSVTKKTETKQVIETLRPANSTRNKKQSVSVSRDHIEVWSENNSKSVPNKVQNSPVVFNESVDSEQNPSSHTIDPSKAAHASTDLENSRKSSNNISSVLTKRPVRSSTQKPSTPDSPKVLQKPSLPTCLFQSRKSVVDVRNSSEVAFKSQRSGSYGGETKVRNASNPESAKSILAGLDFGKYRKRRDARQDGGSDTITRKVEEREENRGAMENSKTLKSSSSLSKASSKKLKDFLDSLKPQQLQDTSTTSKKKRKVPFLCRTASFANTEVNDDPTRPAASFYLSDDNSDRGDDSATRDEDDASSSPCASSRKTSTLPRRKSPSHRPVKSKCPLVVSSMNSCPSIVKLEPQSTTNTLVPKQEPDEGLVSDSEIGSGAYAKVYASCVTSPPVPRRKTATGHVRSCSDDVTASKTREMLIEASSDSEPKPGSSLVDIKNEAPLLCVSPDKRKRRKGVGSMSGNNNSVIPRSSNTPRQEPTVKSSSGRSLTYPPQRKTSVPEIGQHFTSVDSNGLKSLKTLSPGLTDNLKDERHLLSDLSLADSHLCPSEGTVDETYQDVVDSVIRSPDDKLLSVDQMNLTGNGKLPKKKHHSDPGGDISSGVSAEAVAYMADIIGSSRSEPELGLNDGAAAQEDEEEDDDDDDEDDEANGHRHLRAAASSDSSLRSSEPPSGSREKTSRTSHHGSKHVRVASSGSLTCDTRFNFDFENDHHQEFGSSKSPQEQRRYSKRRLRGPYGEMLEEEMRKSGESKQQKSNFGDLGFLQEICETIKKQSSSSSKGGNNVDESNIPNSNGNQSTRPTAVFSSSQSLDDGTIVKSDSVASVPPKRKISANYPLLGDVTTSDSLDGSSVSAIKRSSSSCSQDSGGGVVVDRKDSVITRSANNSSKDIDDGLSEFDKMRESLSDTRTHIVAELYDTEKSYVESLHILVNKYMKPLKSSEYSGIVDAGLVDEIFFQIPDILGHHEEFLEELRQRLSKWDSKQKVGDVFVEAFTKQEVIDTYTAFINNWKSAKDATKIASQAKPAFARFLEHMTREHKGKLTLDALLIMPVQRIPRYELLIKELLKHTLAEHPDHRLLVAAQREVHELALKINRMEREALQMEQMQQRLKDIEQLIDGVVDLMQPDRGFIRHDMVSLPGSLGTRKERCLFLFTDLLLVTSMKRKSGTMRKPSSSTSCGSPSILNSLEMNKYKLLTKFSLDNLDITKSADNNCRKLLKDIENLEEDVSLLNQIGELASSLTAQHQLLDEAVKELLSNVSKQLTEKQSNDSQLASLELTVTSHEGVENLTILFTSPEKRTTWEAAFNEAKQKLALCTDRRPPPEFMHPLPIRKTRAGLQFTCAAATLGLNQQGLRDVWVCNSDGYVGQVCVLSLQPEPTVMSCNGVCNSRILTIASIPAAVASTLSEKSRWRPVMPDNLTGVSIEVEECDEECDSQTTNNGNIELDSDSSDDEDESESPDDDKLKEGRKQRGGSLPRDEGPDDMDHRQPTMWLGTEDGCILLYNCNDNIRTKKNKIKIQHPASIQCIIYLDNRVFVALSNGEIHIYKKDFDGGWGSDNPDQVDVGCVTSPVTKMLAVAGKLWCGCQNMIKIVNTSNLQVEHSFTISNDSSRTVLCMATSGLGVWVALQHSAVLRLFHATTYEVLMDVNVAPAVTKMLSGCDDIIRQHKAACLRVTAMLACKDLLWVGTSAGVVLTLPLPHLTSKTTRLDSLPNIAGLPHGHTGHVRFLTCVEMSPAILPDGKIPRSSRSKESGGSAGRRSSSATSAGCKLLVISGGDGYEDFRNNGLGESAGRDDSTNHLLLWQV